MKEKYYCVYLPYNKYEVLPDEECNNPNTPMYPVKMGKLRICNKPEGQLEIFNNAGCAAAKMFDATSIAEINKKVADYQYKFSTKKSFKRILIHLFNNLCYTVKSTLRSVISS